MAFFTELLPSANKTTFQKVASQKWTFSNLRGLLTEVSISLMKRHIKQWLGSLCCSRLSWIKALHALRDAVIGVEEDGTNAEKWILLDPAAEPSRTLESLQHLIAPSPHMQNKEAEREEASLQVELHTDSPGSSQLMRGRLYCAERCCFCIQ